MFSEWSSTATEPMEKEGRVKRPSSAGRLRTRNVVFTPIIPSLRLEHMFIPDDSDNPVGS